MTQPNSSRISSSNNITNHQAPYWTPEMDRILLEAVQIASKGNSIAFYNPLTSRVNSFVTQKVTLILEEQNELFGQISAKQFSERYKERLCPQIITTKTSEISIDVQKKIFTLVKIYGFRWSLISKILCEEEGGGTKYYPPNTLKNFIYSIKRKSDPIFFESFNFPKKQKKSTQEESLISIDIPIQDTPIETQITPLEESSTSFGIPATNESFSLDPYTNSHFDNWFFSSAEAPGNPHLQFARETIEAPKTPPPLDFKSLLFKIKTIASTFPFGSSQILFHKIIVTIALRLKLLAKNIPHLSDNNISDIKNLLLSSIHEINFKKEKFSEDKFVELIYKKKISLDLLDNLDYQKAVEAHENHTWKLGEKKEIVCIQINETCMTITTAIVGILLNDPEVKQYLSSLNIELTSESILEESYSLSEFDFLLD